MLVLALAVAWVIAGSGCTSVYHRARKELPGDPVAEVRLRLVEAQRSEELVKEAQEKLTEGKETDLDRVEMLALDFERRVLALRDAVEAARHERQGTSGVSAEVLLEVERLERESGGWRTEDGTIR